MRSRRSGSQSSSTIFIICRSQPAQLYLFALLFVIIPIASAAEPTPAALSAFNTYVDTVESRLAQQHRSPGAFLAASASTQPNQAQLRRGELIIERLTPSDGPAMPGAMLHHWRGTAFAPGATAADFQRLMRNFAAYPTIFSPQVVQAKTIPQQGDHYSAVLRVRQKHIITVVMDTTYDVVFSRPDPQHGSSISRSTRIAEIDSAGTPRERALPPGKDHGFLWRLNTYWSYEQRDGGLYMQIESVSLTRSIPTGLGWVIGPFVESVPRESLEFTLRATCNALHK